MLLECLQYSTLAKPLLGLSTLAGKSIKSEFINIKLKCFAFILLFDYFLFKILGLILVTKLFLIHVFNLKSEVLLRKALRNYHATSTGTKTVNVVSERLKFRNSLRIGLPDKIQDTVKYELSMTDFVVVLV